MVKKGKLKFIGTRKPRTIPQIAMQQCCRCGGQAVHQWSICSNDHRYAPLCLECDVALNETVLAFMGPRCWTARERVRLNARYRRREWVS